ncbi:MAG: hypothetical protein ABIR59_02265, partial [Gemmatimonadales bacterium]
MELIDRYVEAVGERIAAPRRHEIEAELRAAILDALEARDESPESEAAVSAVLAEFGAPEVVAAEYEPARRYLIGPELYPDFLVGLRVALTALVIGCTITFGVAVVSGGFTNFRAGELLMDAIRLGVMAALVGVVLMVVVFAWLQRTNRRIPTRLAVGPEPWSPLKLKQQRVEKMSRGGAFFGLVLSAIVLMVLGSIGSSARDALATAPPEWRSALQDGVITSVLLLQAGMVASVIAHAIALVRGGWDNGTRAARFVADVIAVGVFGRAAFMLRLERDHMVSGDALTATQADWLILTAAAVAIVMAVIVIAYWWRVWRRNGAQRVVSGAAA